MKILIGENKRLIVTMDWNDRFDSQATVYAPMPKATIQLKDNLYAPEIEEKCREAIAGVLKEYELLIGELPLKEVFDEKRRQIAQSYDTEEAVADIVSAWDCATLSDEEWTA